MTKKVVLIASTNDFAGNANVVHMTTLMRPPTGMLDVGPYLAAHDVPVELIHVQVDFGFGLPTVADRVASQRVAEYLRDQGDDIAWIGASQPSNASGGLALAAGAISILTDEQGVVRLEDSLTRFPRDFGIESMLLRYDKSKSLSP